ncbi:MAG: hypothetical protein D6717_01730 [Gammaproteobacteria bacterium]|nr:MAG: hypothetical protein D6717_01730 [Gammaproteobacteria bacterium]
MSDISKEERLSALVDGELQGFERRRMVGILTEDSDNLQRWRRDHLVRDALRGELPATVRIDFLECVNAGIDAADGPMEPEARHRVRHAPFWLRAGAGMAVAASVAMVTILGLQSLVGPGGEGEVPAARIARQEPAPVPAGQGAFRLANAPAGSVVRPGVTDREVRERISSYLINHSEFAGRPAMLPYARIVGYETREQDNP